MPSRVGHPSQTAGMSTLEIRYVAADEDNLRLRDFRNDYLVVSYISDYLEGKRQ